MKKIYVGNLPWSMDDHSLSAIFEAYGEVHSSKVVMDRETGRSRGFGFIEMDDADALGAIQGLEGHQIDGRSMTVNEARPRPERGGRGGFGGGGGGGGRGGRGGFGGGGRDDRW